MTQKDPAKKKNVQKLTNPRRSDVTGRSIAHIAATGSRRLWIHPHRKSLWMLIKLTRKNTPNQKGGDSPRVVNFNKISTLQIWSQASAYLEPGLDLNWDQTFQEEKMSDPWRWVYSDSYPEIIIFIIFIICIIKSSLVNNFLPEKGACIGHKSFKSLQLGNDLHNLKGMHKTGACFLYTALTSSLHLKKDSLPYGQDNLARAKLVVPPRLEGSAMMQGSPIRFQRYLGMAVELCIHWLQ